MAEENVAAAEKTEITFSLKTEITFNLGEIQQCHDEVDRYLCEMENCNGGAREFREVKLP